MQIHPLGRVHPGLVHPVNSLDEELAWIYPVGRVHPGIGLDEELAWMRY